MALTVVIALLGAMILSVTFIPADVALFIGTKVSEKENRLMLWAKKAYEPLLQRAISAKAIVLAIAGVAVVLSGLLATRLGSEFIPNLNEGDFAVQTLRIPGTSLSQSVQMQQQLERPSNRSSPRSSGYSRARVRPKSLRNRCRRTYQM